MVDDISLAIRWTISNIKIYQGDSTNIILAGQSSGAHICMCLLVDTYDKLVWKTCTNEHKEYPNRLTLNELTTITMFIGVSGPYNLKLLQKHLHKRGLDSSILSWICSNNIIKYSPTLTLQNLYKIKSFNQYKSKIRTNELKIKQSFPNVVLFHGSHDKTVSSENSIELADILKKFINNSVELVIYDGLSHTDPILEYPLMGNNHLLYDIIEKIDENTHKINNHCHIHDNDNNDHKIKPIPFKLLPKRERHEDKDHFAPKCLVKLAKKFNPF